MKKLYGQEFFKDRRCAVCEKYILAGTLISRVQDGPARYIMHRGPCTEMFHINPLVYKPSFYSRAYLYPNLKQYAATQTTRLKRQ
jgi:hypothetical protein